MDVRLVLVSVCLSVYKKSLMTQTAAIVAHLHAWAYIHVRAIVLSDVCLERNRRPKSIVFISILPFLILKNKCTIQ